MNSIGDFLNGLGVILAIIVISHGLRSLWFFALRRVGLWNPEHFHRWVWVPWRALAEQWIKFGEWRTDEFHSEQRATARWGGLLGRLVLVFKPGDVLLGGFGYYGFRLFQPLGFKAQRHLSMVAGTGTGKTTLLITMLGLHKGNAFVIDPKGQITNVIANRRGKGGNGVKGMDKDVGILDPNGIVTGHTSSSWNAMDELARVEARLGQDAVVRYAKKMAEGLVPMEGDKPYFPTTARAFVRCLILHVYTIEPPETRTMLRVRDLLTLGLANELKAAGATAEEIRVNSFKALLHEMQQNKALDGAVAKGAATLSETGRSYGDILSTARAALDFYDLPEIRKISRHSDFSLEDLKLGNLDLFLCAPTGDIRETYRGWFRLLTVIALDLFEQIPGNLETPCLFAIDEMPSLGAIDGLAKTAPVMRSYGVRLLAITQNLELLQEAYPKNWRSFLGDSDVTYWMGTNEKDTGTFLSEYLGKRTQTRRKHSKWAFWRWWRLWWATGEIVNEKDVELLTPQQVMKILSPRKQNMIVTRFGMSPIRLKTMPYYRELPVYFYDADAEHKEAGLRAWMRNLIRERGCLPWESGERWAAPCPDPVIDPEPIIPDEPIEVTASDAMEIFGLSEPCSLSELRLRKKMLDQQAKASPDYARTVEYAFNILSERMSA